MTTCCRPLRAAVALVALAHVGSIATVDASHGASAVTELLGNQLRTIGPSPLTVEARPSGTRHAVVFDAGSSGTRFYLYSWQATVFEIDGEMGSDSFPALPLARPEEVEVDFSATPCGKAKVSPGLSGGGVQKLEDLVRCALSVAPLNNMDVRTVPVHLLATGGLRLMFSAERETVLDKARDILSASGLRFERSQARILSGEEEGVFAWLAVNQVEGRLATSAPHSLENTYGMLEMGGASAQITFKPQDPNIFSGSYRVQLGHGLLEHVYSHSHLYFGMNEAKDRLLRALGLAAMRKLDGVANPNSNAFLVQNPCWSKGAAFSVDTLTERGDYVLVQHRGTGDASMCSHFLMVLLAPAGACLTEPRAAKPTVLRPEAALMVGPAVEVTLNDVYYHPLSPRAKAGATVTSCVATTVYQPQIARGNKIMIVGSLSYIWSYLDIGAPDEGLHSKSAKAAAKACNKSWDVVQGELKDDTFAEDRCFQGNFLTALFGVLGLSGDMVEFSKNSYSWTYGAALTEANSAPVVMQRREGATNTKGSVDRVIAEEQVRVTSVGSSDAWPLISACLAALCCMLMAAQWKGRPSARAVLLPNELELVA